MKNSKIPFAPLIPKTWREIPNRYLFIEHSKKVGERWGEYQLLSLTTNGVKVKNINDTGGKVPDSYSTYQTVEAGDMVFCLFDLDCSAVFSGLSPFNGMITSAYDVFRTNTEYLDNTFARFWFDYVFSRRYYKMFSKNIRYTITTDVFRSIYTPCPPIEEQQRIGVFLVNKCSEIDKMISLQERIVEELKAYKQSIITEAVTKGLNPEVPMKDSGIEWIGVIPNNWKIARLRSLGTTQNGISQGGDYFGEGNPFVNYSDVYKNYSLPVEVKGLAKSNEKEQRLFSVKKGDIFFTRTSETIEEIGFSSVCLETIPKAVFAGFLIRFRPNDDTLDSLFAKYYFRSDIHRAFFVKEMNIVIRASLSQDLLKSLPVLLPSKNEQHEIGAFLDERCSEIDNLISVRQAKIEALKEYKKSIIYEYVTGKKEVNG